MRPDSRSAEISTILKRISYWYYSTLLGLENVERGAIDLRFMALLQSAVLLVSWQELVSNSNRHMHQYKSNRNDLDSSSKRVQVR